MSSPKPSNLFRPILTTKDDGTSSSLPHNRGRKNRPQQADPVRFLGVRATWGSTVLGGDKGSHHQGEALAVTFDTAEEAALAFDRKALAFNFVYSHENSVAGEHLVYLNPNQGFG